MKKLNLIGVCALTLMLFSTMVITLNLPNFMSSSKQELSHINLIVYQIGLSHVIMTIPVEFVNSKATITLPSSVILQTLRITGVDIISMKLRQKIPQQLFFKGDSIVVHTQSATYEGTYEGAQEGYLVIIQEGRSTLVNLNAITAIEISRAVTTKTQENAITLEINANVSGSCTLNVSFLSRSISWCPSHFLDLNEGKIQTWAMVVSSENWTDASLTLIVGQPHVIFERPVYSYDEGVTLIKSNEFKVSNLEEYYAYKYERPFTISSGETAMIRLLSGILRIEKEYFWAGGYYSSSSSSTPIEYVNITNILKEPIPEGAIQFYRGNEWIGNDKVPYIAANSTARLMVAYAHDLKVEQKTIKIEHLSGIDKITIQVKATNYKTEKISITIQQTIPYRATLEFANPKPKQEGQILIWIESLNPGESNFITYTYSLPVEK